MKEIENKTEQKTKKPDWNKILNIALFLVIITIFALGMVLYQTHKKKAAELDMSHPFELGELLTKDVTKSSNLQIATPFSDNLCVSLGNENVYQLSLSALDEKGLLFNLDENKALYAYGIYDRIYPASLTKIMTAILAMEKGNMSDVVTISKEAVTLEDGSQMSGMQEGDTVTMDQLFHSLMIYSANDAAMAIAEHIGGSVEGFVQMMNEKASELGMTGTHFANPHGLHDENHYTTAYDVYLMLNYAYKNQMFYNTMQMNVYTLTTTRADGSQMAYRLDSTDKYLTGQETPPEGVTVLGGKTGTTPEAGNCLAILSQNKYGQPHISIVLNAKSKQVLYDDMNLLLQQINH